MNYVKSLLPVSLLALTSALSGCAEDVDSEAIRTDGMYANIQILAIGDGDTLVTTEIRVGGDNGTYVELTGDDGLFSTTDGEDNSRLSHKSSGNRHSYHSTHNTQAGGTVVNVELERGDADDSAPESSAVLPEPFVLSLASIEEGDAVKRGEDVELSWDNETDGVISWEIEGDCIWSDSGEEDDNDNITLNGDIFRATGTSEGETCDVMITMERTNSGTVDSAYGEGGKIVAIQRRAVIITSTPADWELEDGGGGAGGATP